MLAEDVTQRNNQRGGNNGQAFPVFPNIQCTGSSDLHRVEGDPYPGSRKETKIVFIQQRYLGDLQVGCD